MQEWIGRFMVELVSERRRKPPYISDQVEAGKREPDRRRWDKFMRKALSAEEMHAC